MLNIIMDYRMVPPLSALSLALCPINPMQNNWNHAVKPSEGNQHRKKKLPLLFPNAKKMVTKSCFLWGCENKA